MIVFTSYTLFHHLYLVQINRKPSGEMNEYAANIYGGGKNGSSKLLDDGECHQSEVINALRFPLIVLIVLSPRGYDCQSIHVL